MNTIATIQNEISSAETALATGPDRRAPANTVGARASATPVKVPSWFTVAAASRVAQLKGVAHLLVLDRGVVVGTISARALAAAPGADPLARWMTPSSEAVSPETSSDEAWRKMALAGVECLPVVSGMLLVGLVTREDLSVDEVRIAG